MFETMQTSDWVLIVSTLILAVTALIAPHVYDWIKRKLYAPKVEIEFFNEPPYCHQTIRKVQSMADTHVPRPIVRTFPVHYCRFIVHNIRGKHRQNFAKQY